MSEIIQVKLQRNGEPVSDTVEIVRMSICQRHDCNDLAEIQYLVTDESNGFAAGDTVGVIVCQDPASGYLMFDGKVKSHTVQYGPNGRQVFILNCINDFPMKGNPDTPVVFGCSETIYSFSGEKTAEAINTIRFSNQGTALVSPGSQVGVSGVDPIFEKGFYVTEVIHEIGDGDWKTSIHASDKPGEAPVLSASTTGTGLYLAEIVKLSGDPEGKNRVQVKVRFPDTNEILLWAFYTSPYAGGWQVYPEIGSTLVIAPVNGADGEWLVIGSLENAASVTRTESNDLKRFVTQKGCSWLADDAKKEWTISTPAANKIVLSDDLKSIVLEDQNGNKLQMDENGITISSPKDIRLDAQGAIVTKSVLQTEITATQDLSIQAMNIHQEAQVGVTVKGNATAELSASGQTTVKGALVMIN